MENAELLPQISQILKPLGEAAVVAIAGVLVLILKRVGDYLKLQFQAGVIDQLQKVAEIATAKAERDNEVDKLEEVSKEVDERVIEQATSEAYRMAPEGLVEKAISLGVDHASMIRGAAAKSKRRIAAPAPGDDSPRDKDPNVLKI